MKNINPNPFTTRPEIEGTFGVVASTHWIATAVGMAALERGGNAFDAAVAGQGTAERREVVRAPLEEAIALHRGPLLEGWEEEWVFEERPRVRIRTECLPNNRPVGDKPGEELQARFDPLIKTLH